MKVMRQISFPEVQCSPLHSDVTGSYIHQEFENGGAIFEFPKQPRETSDFK